MVKDFLLLFVAGSGIIFVFYVVCIIIAYFSIPDVSIVDFLEHLKDLKIFLLMSGFTLSLFIAIPAFLDRD